MSSNKKAFVVGLTGQSGSGKSTVAQTFAENGYALINADEVAKRAVIKGSDTLKKLCAEFGDEILFKDGSLDRKKLAKIAFSSHENTQKLNSITHPAIVDLVISDIKAMNDKGYSKIVYDAPTLFESKSDSLCDVIVSVIAKRDIRISRIISRDKISIDEALSRLKAQKDDSFYIDRSDFVIENNSDKLDLINKTQAVISAIDEVYNGSKI